ncbi:MAG: hypothetical protein OXI38_08150 [Bacteroidota bacterium]|nr:hypothetical protein [Bacteroidota bacterium]
MSPQVWNGGILAAVVVAIYASRPFMVRRTPVGDRFSRFSEAHESGLSVIPECTGATLLMKGAVLIGRGRTAHTYGPSGGRARTMESIDCGYQGLFESSPAQSDLQFHGRYTNQPHADRTAPMPCSLHSFSRAVNPWEKKESAAANRHC